MSKLTLSVAIGNYDRSRPLVDGEVSIDGVDPIFMLLSPEEIFFRAFRGAVFDVCELSLSSFVVKIAAGDPPYVGVPAFLSRAFRHASIYVRTDRVRTPEDLKGKRIGVPEYQLTANVWARGILDEFYGVKPSDVRWVRGGLEAPGRPEKVAIELPADVRLEDAPAGRTISEMLDDGDIDALIAPRAPSSARRNAKIGWLFADADRASRDYFRKTAIFPIMHLVGIRRELVDKHPWLPMAVFKAFDAAKQMAVGRLADVSAIKVTLPFVEEQMRLATDLMGQDYWSYGVEPNRKVLETFLRYHHQQGLSPRQVAVDELFHPSTYAQFKV